MTRRSAEHVLRCQEWERVWARKLYASNKCFIWVKSIPICVQSWNSSNLQTNLLRNSKVTCHNFLFPEVLAAGRALDWARINPVIKPWQRMMEPDILVTSPHYHLSLSLHLITDPENVSISWQNMSGISLPTFLCSFPRHDTDLLRCNVTLHWWLSAHIVFGMLSINQFVSPGDWRAGVVTW